MEKWGGRQNGKLEGRCELNRNQTKSGKEQKAPEICLVQRLFLSLQTLQIHEAHNPFNSRYSMKSGILEKLGLQGLPTQLVGGAGVLDPKCGGVGL
jgi:hypothetical protein